MRNAVLITGLLLLLVANVLMAYYAPFGLSPREGFQANMGASAPPANMGASAPPANGNVAAENSEVVVPESPATEGYTDLGATAGGAKDSYKPMGAYDGVALPTGNSVSKWRYTAPNEPLMGAEFTPGPDSLFMFKNNQCKPECCGASFSCGGGCVCTTPQQRQMLAARGGNRTAPEDSA